MNHWIEPINVTEVTKSFLETYKENDTAKQVVIEMACELLDVSDDKLVEMLEPAQQETGNEGTACENVSALIDAWLLDHKYLFDNTPTDATYTMEAYCAQGDRLDEKTVGELVESEEPLTELFNLFNRLDDIYMDSIHEEYTQLIADLEKDLEKEHGVNTVDCHDTISDYVHDKVSITAPYEHYLAEKYRVNIIMDTGDANYDYSINAEPPFVEKSGMAWLASTQGYDLETLNREMEKEDEALVSGAFLRSAYVEVNECPSSTPAVCFLVKMPLSMLLALCDQINHKAENGTFHVSKETYVGLYDFMSGGGSLLEIELEKDIDIPIRFIRSATPDVNDCMGVRWCVGEAYGMCESAWKEV